MGRLHTSGGEIQDHPTTDVGSPDGYSAGAAITVTDTTVKRSGACAFRCQGTAANSSYRVWPVAGASGTGYYARAWVRLDALPSSTARLVAFVTAGDGALASARLTAAGKLQLWVAGAQSGSDSDLTLLTDTWYRIELYVKVAAGAADEAALRVLDSNTQFDWEDGIEVASATGLTISDTAPGKLLAGWVDAPGVTSSAYLDDIALNDSAGTQQNSWPGQGCVLYMPVEYGTLNQAWTSCQSGDTKHFLALNVRPPAMHADSTTDTARHQVRSGSNASASVSDIETHSFGQAGMPGNCLPIKQTSSTDAILGNFSATARLASSFFCCGTFDYLKVQVKKVGAPTDDVVVEFRPDDGAGKPSTTILKSWTIANASISSAYADIRLDFDPPYPGVVGERYWIAYKRSGAVDTTNYFQVPVAGGSNSERTTTIGTAAEAWSAPTASRSDKIGVYTTQGTHRVSVIVPHLCHAEAIATGTKTGSLQLITQAGVALASAATFTFGNDLGAGDVYPTNWRWVMAPPAYDFLFDAASDAVRTRFGKTDGTTRVAMLGVVGCYAEWLLPEPGLHQYRKNSDSTLWWAQQASVLTTWTYGDPSTDVVAESGDWFLTPDPLPTEGVDFTSIVVTTTSDIRTNYTKV